MTFCRGSARLLTSSRSMARVVGAGRLLAGGAFLAAPVAATRALGLDTATAKRVAFLARMMAARDLAIGAGTALAAWTPCGRPGAWLLAGAAADATDAVVIAEALRGGRARGPVASGTVVVAAGAAALAVAGVLGSFRPRRRRG